MSECREIIDCSVFGITNSNSNRQSAVAHVRLKKGSIVLESELLRNFNKILFTKNLNTLSAVKIVLAKDITLGTTGKVLKRQLRDKLNQQYHA